MSDIESKIEKLRAVRRTMNLYGDPVRLLVLGSKADYATISAAFPDLIVLVDPSVPTTQVLMMADLPIIEPVTRSLSP